MLPLIADENFRGDIIRGLLRKHPQLDLVRVQDVGLRAIDDPSLLAWSARGGRIVLTHDRATMPGFAYERIVAGLAMPGLFVIDDRVVLRSAIDEILLVDACSDPREWEGRVLFLPL